MSDVDAPDSSGPEPQERAPRLASDKQLKFVAVLQRKIGLSDDELADVVAELGGEGGLEDLTRRQASELIDEMHIRARDRGVDLDAQPRASDKQIGFLRSLRRRAHLTEDEFGAFLEERAGVSDVEQVGKRDASRLIDELLARAEGRAPRGGEAPDRAPRGGEAPARAPAPMAEPEDGYDDPPF